MNFFISTSDSHRTFCLWVLAGFLLTAVAWVLLIIGQLGLPHAENMWVKSTYEKKQSLARQDDTPKVLIVGGSGAMFGLDSQQLTNYLSSNVINLGVNAGLQTQWIAHYANKTLQPGDSIIFALEYPLYFHSTKLNHVALSYSLSHPEILNSLSPITLIDAYWSVSLKRIVEGYRGVPDTFNVALGTYGPHNIGPRGDQINSTKAQRAVWMQEGLEHHPGEAYAERFATQKLDITPWLELATKVKQAGGCTAFIPPALMHNERYNKQKEKMFYDNLAERLNKAGIKLTGQPRDFFYPMDDFFDTNFHLTAEARQRHTQSILPLLQTFKQCLQSRAAQ